MCKVYDFENGTWIDEKELIGMIELITGSKVKTSKEHKKTSLNEFISKYEYDDIAEILLEWIYESRTNPNFLEVPKTYLCKNLVLLIK